MSKPPLIIRTFDLLGQCGSVMDSCDRDAFPGRAAIRFCLEHPHVKAQLRRSARSSVVNVPNDVPKSSGLEALRRALACLANEAELEREGPTAITPTEILR